MIFGRVNWLAVFAVGVASYAVLSNGALAFSTNWLVGFLVGAVAALASSLDTSGAVNRWMAFGALTLALVLVALQNVSDEARGVTSGACAGMLLALGANFAIKCFRK